MYKVYYNDRVILFGDKKNLNIKEKEIRVYSFPEIPVPTIWKRFKKNAKLKKIYIKGNGIKIAKELIEQFNLVKAGGGLVKNESGEYLLIYRNKKWDLPKGKLEKGENARNGAKREVAEECGITGVRVISFLQETYHIYRLRGKLNIKLTKWFEMSYSGSGTTKPQLEEGIEKAIWVRKTQIPKLVKNMYPSIVDILKNKKLLKE
jgi:ADP-ribose pyrophosphatase YjhB (NUDIX family)